MLSFEEKSAVDKLPVMLRSLKAITKETSAVPRRLWRSTPDPGFSAQVELRRCDAGGLLDLFGIGKTLPCKRIAAEEPPPTLLQIQPACASGNEDMMDAWMSLEPGTGLEAEMTTEIVGNDEEVALGIVGFDVGEQGDVAFGVA